METLQFKTNINCSSCVRAVSPRLNALSGISNWQVDTLQADKLLTVSTTTATAQSVIQAVQDAGFTIERLS